MKIYKVPEFLYEPMLNYIASKPAGEVGRLLIALQDMVQPEEEAQPNEEVKPEEAKPKGKKDAPVETESAGEPKGE